MKQVVIGLGVAALGFALAAEPYQVPGFPPFSLAPKMLEVIENRGETVLVRHRLGETEIPRNPQRIITTNLSVFEMVQALDLAPVATFHWGDAWPEYLEPIKGETQFVRHNYGSLPDLEAVLALQPDLVIADKFLEPEAYAQLSKIAPTVMFFESSQHFRSGIRDLAAALGIPARGEQALAHYDAEATKLRQELRTFAGDKSFLYLWLGPGDGGMNIYVHGVGYENERGDFLPEIHTAFLYRDLQAKPSPTTVKLGSGRFTQLSAEVVPELEADFLVLTTRDITVAELQTKPLWETLDTLQNGNVHRFDADLVGAGGYYTDLYRMRALVAAAQSSLGQP